MDISLTLIFFFGCMLLTQVERHYYSPYLKWFFIIPFCLLVANRDLSVPDTEAYVNYFSSTDTFFDNFEASSFEIGFQILSKFINIIIGENFILYFGCITLINLLIINYSINRIGKLFKSEQEISNNAFLGENRFFRNTNFTILPLTLYAAFFGIYVNAIVLRVGIPFSLLILASSFLLKDKKNFLDILIINFLLVLSCLFHATALIGIFILLILCLNINFSIKSYFLGCLLIGLLYLFNLFPLLGNVVFSFIASLNELAFLASKLSPYEGDVLYDADAERISFKFCFFLIMAFVLILFKIKSKIYFKILNVYLLGLAIFAIFRSVLLIERVTDYFLIFSFIIFYLFLIMQRPFKSWMYFVLIIILQLIFVLRITNLKLT